MLANPLLRAALFSARPGWVLPSAAVDIDFTTGRSYGGTLDTLLSISRASVGYAQDSDGTLKLFGSNTRRRTGLGLLIEEARTNLALQSQTFQTTWIKGVSGDSVTADQVAAPDGSVTADLFSEDGTTSSSHGLFQNISLAASTNYVATFYLKYAGRQWVRVFLNSGTVVTGSAYFDIQNGAVGSNSFSVGTFVSASIAQVANGFYRIVVVFTTAAATGSVPFDISSAGGNGTTSAVGLSGSAFYAWGAQLEAGGFATSYIPTTTTSAMRAADNIVTSALPAAAPWSLFVQGGGTPVGGVAILLEDHSGSFDYALVRSGQAQTGSGGFLSAVLGSGATSGLTKIAVGYDSTGRSIVDNNGTVAKDTTTWGAAVSPAYLGSSGGASAFYDGYIQRLAAFKSRLSDAALKALTQ